MSRYIIQLERGVWLVPERNDPTNRTLDREFARQYKTKAAAKAALTRARRVRRFPSATVEVA